MTRLRQVVLACADYESAAKELCKELESFVTFRDPGLEYFGLENGLIPIGSAFLEIVTPLPGREDSSAGGRYIKRFGDGGYMILVQVDGPEELRHVLDVAEKRKLKLVNEGSRTTTQEDKEFSATSGPGINEDGIAGVHFHPKDVGCIAEIAANKPLTRWTWAGSNWTKADERTKIAHSPSDGLAGAEIATPDFVAAAELWTELLKLAPEQIDRSDSASVALTLNDGCVMRFRAPRNSSENGLVKIQLFTSSPRIPHGHIKNIRGCDFEFFHHHGHDSVTTAKL